eukprot:g17260.t1
MAAVADEGNSVSSRMFVNMSDISRILSVGGASPARRNEASAAGSASGGRVGGSAVGVVTTGAGALSKAVRLATGTEQIPALMLNGSMSSSPVSGGLRMGGGGVGGNMAATSGAATTAAATAGSGSSGDGGGGGGGGGEGSGREGQDRKTTLRQQQARRQGSVPALPGEAGGGGGLDKQEEALRR